MALNMHEIALRSQAKLDLAAGPGGPRKVAPEWKDALTWWQRYRDEYGTPPGPHWSDVRRNYAAALAATGEWQRAATLLEDTSGTLMDLEKTADLYTAKQYEKKAGAK
jgi:hypothetical protein